MFFRGSINSCNITGRWSVYDAEVEEACLNLNTDIYKVTDGFQFYGNMFCALCNMVGEAIYYLLVFVLYLFILFVNILQRMNKIYQ